MTELASGLSSVFDGLKRPRDDAVSDRSHSRSICEFTLTILNVMPDHVTGRSPDTNWAQWEPANTQPANSNRSSVIRRRQIRTASFYATAALIDIWLVTVHPLGQHGSGMASVLLILLASVYAFWVAAAAALRLSGRERTGVLWILAAGVCLVLVFVVYAYYQVVLQQSIPNPSLANLFIAVAFPLVVVGTCMYTNQRSLFNVQIVFDSALFALAVFFITWDVALKPIYALSQSNVSGFVLLAAYVVAEIVMVSFLVFTVAAARSRQRSGLLFAMVGWMLYLVGTVPVLAVEHHTLTQFGTWADIAWLVPLGFLNMFPASLEQSEGTADELKAVLSRRVTALAPVLPTLGAVIAGGIAFANHAFDGVMVWTAVVLFSGVMIRQVAVILDNIGIAEKLRDRGEQLEYLAYHDALTGLANRPLFYHHVERAIAMSSRSENGPFYIVFMDLDRFKDVNDEFGHAAGDAVLCQVAKRLESHVRPGDLPARIGGDEFAVLLAHIRSEGELDAITTRLAEAVAAPVIVDGSRMDSSTSVGTAKIEVTDTVDTVIHRADAAMYFNKTSRESKTAVHKSPITIRSRARSQ